jgi:hypothetical protein
MKTSHIVIGGVIAVGAIAALYASKHMMGGGAKHARYGTAGSKIQHHPKVGDQFYAARLARKGGTPIEDSGITNVGQYDSGGVKWHGWQASPWSPMTAKNENYTYARTPTNKLLHTYQPGKLDHMKLQGATGLTRYLPGITYTYW